jgi:SPP1 gp7 family putative phage head morphogenesis protein
MIEAMHRDVHRAVRRQWRMNTPEMAGDESPAAGLRRMMGRLAREWSSRFADFAISWSRKFTSDAAAGADRAFSAALRKAGFTVKFQMTAAANDVMQATIGEQVGLIKSIPEQYLKDVEGDVMRSVQTGRDLAGLTADIERNYGVTHRRAAFIARDQNNKATATITRVRQQELGIEEAEWLHSAGGRQPRPTHVANSRKRYNIREGWLDPATNKRIWPGTEINCRCVAKSIIPGL